MTEFWKPARTLAAILLGVGGLVACQPGYHYDPTYNQHSSYRPGNNEGTYNPNGGYQYPDRGHDAPPYQGYIDQSRAPDVNYEELRRQEKARKEAEYAHNQRAYGRNDQDDSRAYNAAYAGYGYSRSNQACDPDGDRCYSTSDGYWDYREYYRRHGYRWKH